jgi:hypothetical protein
MLLDKHIQLLEKLYDKTASCERRWKETIDKGVFQISSPNYTVQIAQPEGVERISIVDDDSEVIESFSYHDVRRAEIDESQKQDLLTKFEELYQMARRQALGADKALDDLLEYL